TMIKHQRPQSVDSYESQILDGYTQSQNFHFLNSRHHQARLVRSPDHSGLSEGPTVLNHSPTVCTRPEHRLDPNHHHTLFPSSPSFWSYRTCSTFPTVRARRAGGAPPQPARHLSRRAPSLTFIAPQGFECTLRPLSPTPSACTCDRTRKMVNYAWAGRSLRKLWWRSVAVLTCKSVKSVRGPVKTLVLKRGTDFRSPAGYRQVPHPTVTDLEGTNNNLVLQKFNEAYSA
ncbi:hypothetical protein NQZ68_025420, partial [Dissostichus eleginoides]